MTEGPAGYDPGAIAMLLPSRIARIGAAALAEPPTCPLCAGTMARRTVRSGPRSGTETWTCEASPRCRGTLDVGGTFGRSAPGRRVTRSGGCGSIRNPGEAPQPRFADGVLQPSHVAMAPLTDAASPNSDDRGRGAEAPASALDASAVAPPDTQTQSGTPDAAAPEGATVASSAVEPPFWLPATVGVSAAPPEAAAPGSVAVEPPFWLATSVDAAAAPSEADLARESGAPVADPETSDVTIVSESFVASATEPTRVRGLEPDADALRRIGLWPVAPDLPAARASLPSTGAPSDATASPLVLPSLPAPAPATTAAAAPPDQRQVRTADAGSRLSPLVQRLLTAGRMTVATTRRGARTAVDRGRPVAARAAARAVDFTIDVLRPTEPAAFVAGRDVAGASAQEEFERRRSRHRVKMRAALPAIVGVTLIGMAMAFAVLLASGAFVAAIGAVGVGALGVWAIGRLPHEALAFGRGAAGERRTAGYLEELTASGYVLLHDRLAPGLRTNVDHIAIGPAGVFVIETKNLRGKLTIAGEKLFVGERTRTGAVDDTYRESVAVQVALAERLNVLRMTVRPVLCVHRTPQLLLDNEVQGVRVVSGSELPRYVRRLPSLLDAETVQELASLADSRLLPAIP